MSTLTIGELVAQAQRTETLVRDAQFCPRSQTVEEAYLQDSRCLRSRPSWESKPQSQVQFSCQRRFVAV